MYQLLDFLGRGGRCRQMFAPDDGANGGNGGGATDDGKGGGNPAPELKYTDEQVNDLVAKNKGKLLKSLGFDDEKAAKEALAAYRAKDNDGKTDEQKRQEEAAASARAAKERDDALAKLTQYERKDAVRDANVPKQFVDFVTFQVSGLVTDETDFKTALGKYLKDNPQYTVAPSNKPNGNTGMPQGGNPAKSDEEAYLEKKYGKNPYYKK